MDCNRDCFNCPFDDCIQEDITDSEIASIESRGGNPNLSIAYIKRRDKVKEYYRTHSEERKKYQLDRYYRIKATKDKHTCNECIKPLDEGYTFKLCPSCREKKKIQSRKNKMLKKSQTENVCNRCNKPLDKEYSYKMCSKCREYKRVYQNMKYRQKAI